MERLKGASHVVLLLVLLLLSASTALAPVHVRAPLTSTRAAVRARASPAVCAWRPLAWLRGRDEVGGALLRQPTTPADPPRVEADRAAREAPRGEAAIGDGGKDTVSAPAAGQQAGAPAAVAAVAEEKGMSEKAEEARRADESSEEAGAATEEEAAEEGDEELARMRRELAEGDSAELVVARYSNCSARPACSLHRPATTRLLLPPPRQHTASHRRRTLPHSARKRRLSARGSSTDAFACAV